MEQVGLRLLVDIGVGKKVERWLQEHGHDVKSVRDIDPRMSDKEILKIAISEKRLVVTNVLNVLLIFLIIFGSLTCTSQEKQAQNHFKKGFEYHNQGSMEKAIEEYKQALTLNPKYIDAYMNIGAIYVGKKGYDQAIQQFKKVIELNYYYGKAHYNLGLIYLYQGEKGKAQEVLKILKSMSSGLADNLEKKIGEN